MAVKKGAKKKQKKRVSKLKGEEQAPELPAIEDTPPRTVPGWVTTFADLMSLLMVFFVMLVSVSTIEKTTFEKMVGPWNLTFLIVLMYAFLMPLRPKT